MKKLEWYEDPSHEDYDPIFRLAILLVPECGKCGVKYGTFEYDPNTGEPSNLHCEEYYCKK